MNSFVKAGLEYNYFPTFIPPFVLENLAKSDVEEAKSTILQTIAYSQVILNERAKISETKESMLKAFAPRAATAGKADRYIWDLQGGITPQQGNPVRKEGEGPTTDPAVNNAFDFMGDFRDFLKTKLNRNSLDDNGMDLKGNVHYGRKYSNAYWDGKQMIFGDGDGKLFLNFSNDLDVVAHEMGHGVVHYYSDFEYKGQSGALHEHFADVFGTAATQFIEKETADTADWIIGDDILGPELYGEALRSMSEPGTAYDNSLLGKDPQPAHMKDYFSGTEDNQGVHINNGIMNKAFYLTAKEIGTDQAVLIWYRALQTLWPTANFNDAFTQISKAARLLVKENKIHKGAPQRVRTAFSEVGLPFKANVTTGLF